MSVEFPYVDGKGHRFRVESAGNREWYVWAKCGDDEEEIVGGLQHCDNETIAARMFQFITCPHGGDLIAALGPIVATETVDGWAGEDEARKAEVSLCLVRHLNGDWGNIGDETRDKNIQNSLSGEGPLLSEYTVDGRSIRIGTGLQSGTKDLATVMFFAEEAGVDVRGSTWVA
jgi:hypothetical protein